MGKFGPKKLKLPSLAENGAKSVSTMLILIPTLFFPVLNPKSFFWKNLSQKIQSCSFWMKIGTHCISRMLILIPTIAFWIANPRSPYEQIWTEKVKAVCFAWKLAHTHMHKQNIKDVDSYFVISFLKFQT